MTNKKSEKNSEKNIENENNNEHNETIIKKDNKKSENILTTIIALIIVIAIILGIIFFINSTNKTKLEVEEYNGFKFVKDNSGFWNVEMRTGYGDSVVPFYYHPKELENIDYDYRINVGLGFVQKNDGNVIIVFDKKFIDPNLSDTQSPIIAGMEIGKITSQVFGLNTSVAFTEYIEGAQDINIFNCSMADPNNYVFEFRLNESIEKSQISSKGLCGIITVKKPEEAIMLADLISYKLLGIMKQ